MGLIYVMALIMGLVLSAIFAAISSLPAHWAACLVKAECPDLRKTFIILLKGYLFTMLISFFCGILGIYNPLVGVLISVGVMIWIIYNLITTLGVVGKTNIIIFIILLIILGIITHFVLGLLIPAYG